MSHLNTELLLREWREGQTKAERLVAGLLHVEGFQSVDPQCPLGGPDGLKDVICNRDGLSWVVASYFPPTHPTFNEIKKKFANDVAGVQQNSAQAFAFFVNQPLTPSERAQLLDEAKPYRAEIYHLERIRGILDSPKGYGLRLEYLRVAMTEAEQIAFWSAFNYDITRRMLDNERRLERMDAKLNLILQRTTVIAGSLLQPPSSLLNPVNEDAATVETPTATLSLAELCWIHRIITEDTGLPDAVRGRLRAVNVWIGSPQAPTFQPSAPEKVPELTKQFLFWWHGRHAMVAGGERPVVIEALAEFHHRILLIHPFTDANGRVARVLLDQAAHELLGMSIGREFVADPALYFAALRAADNNDLAPLQRLIEASLS
ncbi:Fic family protein [Archangium sp.]|uniref:Fic family protein n=1 Tax=Archangium sp. TaxID=1872627 RepID=UPI00286C4757|nr:Fic family protein [Archangium sp.]